MHIFHIQDFIFYIKDKWPSIGYDAVHFHWATTPKFYAPALAPKKLKEEIIEYIEGILTNPRGDGVKYYHGEIREYTAQYSEPIDSSLKQFLNHLKTADVEAMENLEPNKYSLDAGYFHRVLDNQRGENWKDVVPHMAPIIEKLI